VLSVAITLLLVLIVDSVLFRSVFLGLLTLVPVIAAILLIYSAMGLTGIPLDAATTMFAGISIGLGVDFAVHTLNWICRYLDEGYDLDEAVERIYPNSGRAQFFNFAIFFMAFGIVGVSELPTMQRFGMLVALAILASFLSAITLIPAILKLCRYSPKRRNTRSAALAMPAHAGAPSLSAILPVPSQGTASLDPSGQESWPRQGAAGTGFSRPEDDGLDR
jgi:predicted RND superfamily exporter protein